MPNAYVKLIGVDFKGWLQTTTNNLGEFYAPVKKASYITVEAYKQFETFRSTDIFNTSISNINVVVSSVSQV